MERSILLVLTGMGRRRAEIATEFVLNKYPVRVLVSCGFSGALNDKSIAGDVVISSTLNCDRSQGSSSSNALYLNSSLVAAAEKSGQARGFRFLTGRGVSISHVCVTPQNKSDLGREFDADIVDMESYWIGQIATSRNLPFIAVRSISDSVKDDLSFLSHIIAKDQFKPLKAMSYFVAHPTQIRKALVLFSNTRKAGKNLANYLNRLVKVI